MAKLFHRHVIEAGIPLSTIRIAAQQRKISCIHCCHNAHNCGIFDSWINAFVVRCNDDSYVVGGLEVGFERNLRHLPITGSTVGRKMHRLIASAADLYVRFLDCVHGCLLLFRFATNVMYADELPMNSAWSAAYSPKCVE